MHVDPVPKVDRPPKRAQAETLPNMGTSNTIVARKHSPELLSQVLLQANYGTSEHQRGLSR